MHLQRYALIKVQLVFWDKTEKYKIIKIFI